MLPKSEHDELKADVMTGLLYWIAFDCTGVPFFGIFCITEKTKEEYACCVLLILYLIKGTLSVWWITIWPKSGSRPLNHDPHLEFVQIGLVFTSMTVKQSTNQSFIGGIIWLATCLPINMKNSGRKTATEKATSKEEINAASQLSQHSDLSVIDPYSDQYA